MNDRKRIVVGISGASGVIYGVRVLEALRRAGVETHLVMTKSAEMTLAYETKLKAREVRKLADVVYAVTDIGAPISSGSFRTLGMIVAPCSIRSLAEIAYGTTTTLLSRAADVALKERRRVVLLVREAPLHVGHLRAMTHAAEAGAIIVPPVPAFYPLPASVEDIVNHTVGRALDLFEIDTGKVARWGETGPRAPRPPRKLRAQ